eukprot:gnl/MRDRNA2_/MRDRNA2_203914_c0_seq1.p2 gnl/MRDRNA2_/MRDRNA2_203914_c0~~gnl/MRDRNA2_/MRDRNA2_203914_c0_seq1.p2  ORF type:complete len:146 (+),score=8.88 gnl/MRDRNA2_/MRDRNA2_203914_c0_seq1:562-999(+)
MNLRKYIMLIDDNKIDLFVSQQTIHNLDSDIFVSMFSSSVSALRYFENLGQKANPNHGKLPNLIFLDINMPELSGFQLLEKFDAMDLFKKNNIEIVILSSSKNDSDIEKSKKSGLCSSYITKPLTKDKLEKLLCEASQLQKELKK